MKKMITILSALFIAQATFAQAGNLTAHETSDLFNKIKQLFDSSSTPYPVENLVVKSANDPQPFSGCRAADTYGNAGESYSLPIFYKWRMTVKPQTGPNDPETVYSTGILVSRKGFEFERFEKAIFDGEYLNLDPIPNEESICGEGTTVKDELLRTQSGISAQRKSYMIGFSCKNPQRYFYTRDYRQNGNLLVVKTVTNKFTEYEYCWK